MPTAACPECSAPWPGGATCQDHFHQMLAWENEFPGLFAVHHLAVLCYHLQHPSLYSPEGLAAALDLLTGFLERGLTPPEARRLSREQGRTENREWKITARPGRQGAYPHPVRWRTTAADVAAAGPESYTALVERWARTVLEDLKAAAVL